MVRPAAVVFGQEAYTDLWSKAAALLHSVCMNHALIDGNKRLASEVSDIARELRKLYV